MPEVEVIISVKPADSGILKSVDNVLSFLERFAHTQQIQMQFELTAENIFAFFKTRVDLENFLQFASEFSLEKNPSYSPSESVTVWECTMIKPGNSEGITLLKYVAEKAGTFFGHSGHVDVNEGKMVISVPTNFQFDRYLKNNESARNKMKYVKGAATR
jgi:hypothetical protein